MAYSGLTAVKVSSPSDQRELTAASYESDYSSDDEEQKKSAVDLCKIFAAAKKPLIAAILGEIMIVLSFTEWARVSDEEQSSAGSEHLQTSLTNLRIGYFVVFLGCILIRGVIICLWRHGRAPQSVYAGSYMFFSTVPFFLYIVLYYAMVEHVTTVRFSELVDVGYTANANATGSFTQTCSHEYDASSCDGSVLVGDPAVNCCVRVVGSLHVVQGVVPMPFESLPTVSIHTAFGMSKWLTVLVMSWVWKDAPLVKYSDANKFFINTVWLDILDAVVFGDYVIRPEVQYPLYDIVGSGPHMGRACAAGGDGSFGCDPTFANWIWAVWIIAFSSVAISPALYTVLLFLDPQTADARVVGDAISDLTHSIAMLNEKKSNKFVTEALKLQTQAYKQEEGDDDSQMVSVQGRSGTAKLPKKASKYHVEFSDQDGPAEGDFDVFELDPDFEHHYSPLGKKCCHGWCRVKYLRPKKSHKVEAFERRAKFFDAARAALCLDLPFAVFRFYFDVWLGGFPSVLLLKNLVWLYLSVMLVFACGDDHATCLNMTPIKSVQDLIKGSKLTSIFVGPATMFRIGASLYQNELKGSMEKRKNQMEAHKSWLILEKEKAETDGRPTDSYSQKIDILDAEISSIEATEAEIHF